jgi:uncharacterized membrane protein YkvA (DUF1232 family)
LSDLPAKAPERLPTGSAGPGCFARGASLVVAVLGVMYLLNPTGGVFEMIPDITPFIGNLDEAGVTTAVLFALRTLFKRSGSKR